MRMKEVFIFAEELCVEMAYGEITLDDAVQKLMSEYPMFSSSDAYGILEDIMQSEEVEL